LTDAFALLVLENVPFRTATFLGEILWWSAAPPLRRLLFSFVGGFLATLLFHQLTLRPMTGEFSVATIYNPDTILKVA